MSLQAKILDALIPLLKADINSNFNNKSFGNAKWAVSKLTGEVPSLKKTGALKEGIKVIREGNKVIVRTIEYGRYHNEGTDIIPQRQFIGLSDRLKQQIQQDRLLDNLIKEYLDKELKNNNK